MLDNGYVYLATTRLNLYASATDWALVFELFGFSPRAGIPDLLVTAFTSRPVRTKSAADWVSEEAYRNHLQLYANVEQTWFYPIEDEEWIDPDDCERLANEAVSLILRGSRTPVPSPADCAAAGVRLQEPPTPLVFEVTRALAFHHRDAVLATESERRANLLPELQSILTLEDWHHPDVVDPDALPSRTETFQQLAQVLSAADPALYDTSEQPNTHWSNWPEGGTL